MEEVILFDIGTYTRISTYRQSQDNSKQIPSDYCDKVR